MEEKRERIENKRKGLDGLLNTIQDVQGFSFTRHDFF